MGIIKEPKGVDLIIGPSKLTDRDKKIISDIIAEYKRTGKKPVRRKSYPDVMAKKKKVAA
jgi:hypothetical protein